ncbi:autotransporter domain-containing protein [Psychromonas algicola]|uniref:autotransporter domain-containing protein n=1 Tax=Psychromonas algicola TaxID=2555642 RepID=UPI0010678B24|nr:autotransporter domain-containing protein [Psychromonas sp. RZ5]TEW52784.1 hypothetical protein E2R67_01870 [Psychromonas sp. RZ5]
MKYQSLFVFIFLSCFSSFPAVAKTDITLGIYASDITYTEPNVMQEKGTLKGVIGSVRFNRGGAFQSFEASYARGEMDYVGSGTINDIPDEVFEIKGLFGRDFNLNRDLSLSPYLGLGYRYLNDDSSGLVSSTGASGYEREQVYFYMPIGFELKKNRKVLGFKLSSRIEYDYFISGENNSYLGEISSSYDNITLNQDDGYGYRFSLAFTKAFNNGSSLTIEPFYRYWHIDDSEITYDSINRGWIEPDNNSKEMGISLLLRM